MRPLRLANLGPAMALILILILSPAGASLAQGVPTPEAHLGYRPGDDFHLADWATVVRYFEKVDRASDRVVVRTLGPTTEGRPYIVAVVSSPETLKELDRYRGLQRRLSAPGGGSRSWTRWRRRARRWS